MFESIISIIVNHKIPNLYQFGSAIGLTLGFYFIGKIYYMLRYEQKYYDGAGDDYLRFGKEYVIDKYNSLEDEEDE
jgi:hypothetical protein